MRPIELRVVDPINVDGQTLTNEKLTDAQYDSGVHDAVAEEDVKCSHRSAAESSQANPCGQFIDGVALTSQVLRRPVVGDWNHLHQQLNRDRP